MSCARRLSNVRGTLRAGWAGRPHELLLAIPAYASIRAKDYEYVLEETGLVEKDIDVDEFVEVRPPNVVLALCY